MPTSSWKVCASSLKIPPVPPSHRNSKYYRGSIGPCAQGFSPMSHLCPCNKARSCSEQELVFTTACHVWGGGVCVCLGVHTLLLPHLSSVLASSSPPPPIFLCSILSSSLLSPTTELRLGCYLHKTTTKGARLAFLYGPGSRPLANGAGIRGNKSLLLYCSFTAGTRYLHGGSK